MRKLLIIILICVFGFCPLKADDDKSIVAIKVEGNIRTPASTILNTIRTEEGDKLSSELIQEDIKRLFEQGYFLDIKVEERDVPGGIELVFRVIEKYTVGKIAFDGNRALKDWRLKKSISLDESKSYDPGKLKEDQQKIISQYTEAGFSQVSVKAEVKKDEKKRQVDITFNIEEGTLARVTEVRIEGNKVFTDRQIRKEIKTGRWTLFAKRVFREDILAEDKERVRFLYGRHGYIKARVLETRLDFDESGRKITVTFRIQEGAQYTTGKIVVGEGLMAATKLREGAPFSPQELTKDVRNLYDHFYEEGHLYAKVRADKKVDDEERLVDITYQINKGPAVYVEEVKISGNIKTRDKIIRREILIKPGDRFDLKKIRGSQRRIRNLGRRYPFFDSVTFELEDGSVAERKNIHFKVAEGKTGTFLFGGGYSTIDRFVGFVEIDVENFDIANPPTFGGGGQSLSLRGEIGSEKHSYSLSFTEPWLFDVPVSFGFDLYDRLREWDEYDERREGGSLRLGRRLGEFNTVKLRMRYEDVEIFDLVSDVTEEIRREEGVTTISSLALSLVRDTRDNFFDPRSGARSSISTEVAADFLGGDSNFTKHAGRISWYLPAWKKTCVNLRLEGGVAEKFGDSDYVPIYERFYMGGADSVRGYPYRDIGPKDENDEPIGGDVKLMGNIEYIIPIVKKMKGAIFYDIGNVWSSRDDIDLGDLYSGVGIGIRLVTPIGPLRLDYGYGIEIGEGRVHFTVGWPL